jgi:spore germination cell wall hydrolase CwlJ-like protein
MALHLTLVARLIGLGLLAMASAAHADDNSAPVAADFAMATLLADDSVLASPPQNLAALAAAVDTDGVTRDGELACLATAVYFESRGEPLEGQLAVAQTILNRVDSGRFATSICGVINQPRQFSFDRTRAPRPGSDWQRAQAIARIAANDLWRDVVPRAIAFHAARVAPNWAGKTRVAIIGNHVFYR